MTAAREAGLGSLRAPSPHPLLWRFHGLSLLLPSANYFATQALSLSHIFKSKSGHHPESGFLISLNNGAILTKLWHSGECSLTPFLVWSPALPPPPGKSLEYSCSRGLGLGPAKGGGRGFRVKRNVCSSSQPLT